MHHDSCYSIRVAMDLEAFIIVYPASDQITEDVEPLRKMFGYHRKAKINNIRVMTADPSTTVLNEFMTFFVVLCFWFSFQSFTI